MPKLWTQTVAEHRVAVREAVLVSAAELVARHGLRGVTMSAIAEMSGIGRATLYKYFPDVESILLAWHEHQVEEHLGTLVDVRDAPGTSIARLHRVLATYARLSSRRGHAPDTGLTPLLHRTGGLSSAEAKVRAIVVELITEAVDAGSVRSDVPTEELADYALGALGPSHAPSAKALDRLVGVVIDGLRSMHSG